ncbi:MAG: class I SAM-dependent methyltransferase [Deltaproteobacteria bacterium]|nr:class I SAM-dependent methyltransferase [Deltaproteobacteria bacterium]MBI2229550.1 class I SAM-dependent methyltransferase [Deltaproteobacteria bacterium]
MATDDQVRWDRQHAAGHGSEHASGFLKEILLGDSWPIPRGWALDIATGKGRNAIFLAEQGFDVVAVDVSPVALDDARKRAAGKSLSISWQQADLERVELPEATYDLVVDFNYLQRSLIPQIKAALKPGGHVIFETYLIGQEMIGHPKNPAYLLRHNELLELFRDFRVLCYREGKLSDHGEASFRAGLLAQKLG